jgi:hypothetical protein
MTRSDDRPVELIRQTHDYGCGIASLAMISGQPYNAVREWLVENWPGGTQTPDEWLTTRGIHKGIADYYLAAHGYVWRTVYGGWKLPEWPPRPFAPVHLAHVVQPSGNTHYVVMRADGVVLDPMCDEPRALSDWSYVNNVQGVWSLADRDCTIAQLQEQKIKAHRAIYAAQLLAFDMLEASGASKVDRDERTPEQAAIVSLYSLVHDAVKQINGRSDAADNILEEEAAHQRLRAAAWQERAKEQAETIAQLRAENAELTEKLAALREHTLASNPALRTLHADAVAYLDAVEALAEVQDGAPLSTTIGWLIRQGLLVPLDVAVGGGVDGQPRGTDR